MISLGGCLLVRSLRVIYVHQMPPEICHQSAIALTAPPQSYRAGQRVLLFCYDAVLLGEGGEGEGYVFNYRFADSLLSNHAIESSHTLFDKVIRFEEIQTIESYQT